MPSPAKLSRAMHNFAVPLAALPIFTVVLTGIGLLLRADFDTIQPKTRSGSKPGLSLNVETFLTQIVKANPNLVRGINEIKELRISPSKGVIKVHFKENLEKQYDAHTGELLHTGKRWSSWLVSIHEGTFFAPWMRTFVMLPAAVLLLLLWLSGMVMYLRGMNILHGPIKNRTPKAVDRHSERSEESAEFHSCGDPSLRSG